MDDIFGYEWQDIQRAQQGGRLGRPVNVNTVGDYGCSPLGDGKFSMVPSGDVVNYEERCRRLHKQPKT